MSGQRERRDGTAHTAAGAQGAEEGVGVIPLLPGRDGGSRAHAGTDMTFVPSLPPAPRTHRITITNFCLGKHLVSEGDLLKDQRGSPAYISPDVLSGTCGVQAAGPKGYAAPGSTAAHTFNRACLGAGLGQVPGLQWGSEPVLSVCVQNLGSYGGGGW